MICGSNGHFFCCLQKIQYCKKIKKALKTICTSFSAQQKTLKSYDLIKTCVTSVCHQIIIITACTSVSYANRSKRSVKYVQNAAKKWRNIDIIFTARACESIIFTFLSSVTFTDRCRQLQLCDWMNCSCSGIRGTRHWNTDDTSLLFCCLPAHISCPLIGHLISWQTTKSCEMATANEK